MSQIPASPTPEELKSALKAFKKRLKLTRLDNDSRLNKSPLTGRSGDIVAISPPNQFSQEVWDELVRQGKLAKKGIGMYGLVEK